MKLADMRESITIEKATIQSDLYGNRTNTFEIFCSRWTYANKTMGDEKFEVGKTVEKERVSFVVRFDSKTWEVTPGKYRILFHDKYYNIVSVDNFKYQNKMLTFETEATDE